MRTILLALMLAACSTTADEGTGPGDCTDGRDNDKDELTDCDDPGCAAAAECAPPGMSEDEFDRRALDAICVILTDCFDAYASVQDCKDDADGGAADTDGCVYDAEKAAACIEGLEAQGTDCPADITSWEVPPSCSEVWECPDVGVSETGDTSW